MPTSSVEFAFYAPGVRTLLCVVSSLWINKRLVLKVVRADNFPLGSVLLHKTGLGNQWAVAQVISTLHGNVQLVHMDIPEPTVYSEAPTSDHILPLVLHSDISIVLGSGKRIGILSIYSLVLQNLDYRSFIDLHLFTDCFTKISLHSSQMIKCSAKLEHSCSISFQS